MFTGCVHAYDERWLIMSGEGMYLIAMDEIACVEWYPANVVELVDPGMN